MLNTNQSHRKNIWKIVLILPILASFIYLFQVKVVAQEKNVKFKNETVTNQSFYIFESHYNDSEIKKNIKEIEKKHHLTITIRDIKRNSENEIIAIKLKIKKNEHLSAIHEVNQDTPIDNFAIKITKKNNKEIVEIVGKEEILYPIGTKRMNVRIDSVKTNAVALKVVDIKIPEMPETPVFNINFPTPPDAPNMPVAPKAPTNTNNKKAWANFDKEIELYEKKLKLKENDWKKFETEMKVFEEKMKLLEPLMKKFETEMKVYEEKMKENEAFIKLATMSEAKN